MASMIAVVGPIPGHIGVSSGLLWLRPERLFEFPLAESVLQELRHTAWAFGERPNAPLCENREKDRPE
ncbi:MAG: hypothetical protein HYZ53_21080 [Planctomycetes bacterium]|nr:hypothetical protein [Planctomycetota bacterium]